MQCQEDVSIQTLVHTTFSCISYLRNLYSDDCFENVYVYDTVLKRLIKTEETKQLLFYIENGVYDAISRKYLKSFDISIYIDSSGKGCSGGGSRNSGSVLSTSGNRCISSNSSNNSRNNNSSSNNSRNNNSSSTSSIHTTSNNSDSKYVIEAYTFDIDYTQNGNNYIDNIKKFCILLQKLAPLPSTKYLGIKLYFTADTPSEYQPIGFCDGSRHLYNTTKEIQFVYESSNVCPKKICIDDSVYEKDGMSSVYEKDGMRSVYEKDGMRSVYEKDGMSSVYEKDGISSTQKENEYVTSDKLQEDTEYDTMSEIDSSAFENMSDNTPCVTTLCKTDSADKNTHQEITNESVIDNKGMACDRRKVHSEGDKKVKHITDSSKTPSNDIKKTHNNDIKKTPSNDIKKTHNNDIKKTHSNDIKKTHSNDIKKTHSKGDNTHNKVSHSNVDTPNKKTPSNNSIQSEVHKDTTHDTQIKKDTTHDKQIKKDVVRCTCLVDTNLFDLIYCDKCNQWLHTVCCGFFSNQDKRIPKADYVCAYCEGVYTQSLTRLCLIRRLLSILYNEHVTSQAYIVQRMGVQEKECNDLLRVVQEEGFIHIKTKGRRRVYEIIKNADTKHKLKEYFKHTKKTKTSVLIRDVVCTTK